VKVLIAPDKFKGSLTAKEVCAAIEQGLLKIDPSLSIKSIPMADGGEGTCDILTENSEGTIISVEVSDPLFRKIKTSYGISGNGKVAFIEMARASGLQLLKKEEQNPLNTSTYGTGELIADAINRGVTKIILAIGGSATNDAGIGMAAALGVKFTNLKGETLEPTGENLIHIHTIDFENSILKKHTLEVIVLCDVTNELHGINGAAYVYAPQKGASEKDVQMLDEGLRNFEAVIEQDINFSGAGAAGGLGAGAKVFLNAAFSSGVEYLLKELDIETEVKHADLIITGEGKMDQQTLSGKVVMGMAQLAIKNKKPIIAFAGRNDLSNKEVTYLGLSQVITLVNENTPPKEAMSKAASLLVSRASQLTIL
jgi:glycerate 2-kinase